jgi:glyoxylase-like metal-dependent hydrolase (beta-lactamase superfamily II)
MQSPEAGTSKRRVERLEVGPLSTNCYLLKSRDELAVIDPGGDAELILALAQELGGIVKYVIDTHGHIDHVAANEAVVSSTGAELLIHEHDAAMLAGPDDSLASMIGVTVNSPRPDRLLAEGDKVVVGSEELTVVHTPGHTRGSICLVAGGYAFTGDTLFVDSIGRTDFPGGSTRQMQSSLERLQALLKREQEIFPGHGAPGTFGRALLVNPFLGGLLVS